MENYIVFVHNIESLKKFDYNENKNITFYPLNVEIYSFLKKKILKFLIQVAYLTYLY